MELGNFHSEWFDVRNFIDHVDKVAQKEVDVRIGSIGSPCNRGWSSVGNHVVYLGHGGEFA